LYRRKSLQYAGADAPGRDTDRPFRRVDVGARSPNVTAAHIRRRHGMSVSSAAPEIVRRYFQLAAQPDSDAYFALFADDPTVEDGAPQHRGLAAIRAWRPSAPLVSNTTPGVEQPPAALVAPTPTAAASPGTPSAGRRSRFEAFDDRHIRVLR